MTGGQTNSRQEYWRRGLACKVTVAGKRKIRTHGTPNKQLEHEKGEKGVYLVRDR